jgi:hypothetical protein
MRTQSDPPLVGFLAIIRTMIRHSIKTLSTSTPVEVTIEDNVNGVCTLVVQNTDESSNVYLGNSSVSSSNYGFLLLPLQAFTVELRPYDRLYAIGEAATNISCMSIERAT